ncbi:MULTISPECIES: hydroxyacylglutathione hydrolase [Pseudomonas]|uniref:hydroxyacylglutathione hydrolase n=1 Tax=Pseudomonas TaxID=286 RepID=UPI00257C8F00|nr:MULTISPECIES: hydroxyacylglutathione hydrolase [Pseudomonas]MDT3750644.1 hydroxyacylglutathione hydrolase [Pseudomonas kurunegalensis]
MTTTPDNRLEICALPAFTDNYIWLLADHSNQACAVVDPGDAGPVQAWLAEHPGWVLTDVLITHHHSDHVGGIEKLKSAFDLLVHGPENEPIPYRDRPLKDGDLIQVLGRTINVIGVPGHTSGHLAYHLVDENVLFSGDTLFSAGCGRLFEGTPLQMLTSLECLAALPEQTQVYCAHEYTLSNLRFALAVDPDNQQIAERLAEVCEIRDRGECTLPTRISVERAFNPFLRVREAKIVEVIERHAGLTIRSAEECFAAMRKWKDNF